MTIFVRDGRARSGAGSPASAHNALLQTSYVPSIASANPEVLPVCDAISILSDSEFTREEGVSSGSGTQEDPYVIENCDIPASRSTVPVFSRSRAAVFIANTTAHVIVRNIWAHDGGSGYIGIALLNASNVRVEASRVWSANFGVYMQGASDSTISKSLFWSILSAGLRVGDLVRSSDRNTISDNTIFRVDSVAIDVLNSTHNVITGNAISESFRGIWVEGSSDNLEAGNHVFDTVVGIAVLANSHNNSVRENLIERVELSGIAVTDTSRGNTVEYNELLDTGRGISLRYAFDSRIAFNTIRASEVGIRVLEGSDRNKVVGNVVGALVGIFLCSSGQVFLAPPPNDLAGSTTKIERCLGWQVR